MQHRDGTDLAALLRELKDRSGLSYGVLARRLHVSTSTLHRYCNGDAVPVEFAPVERLGRACGATSGEMVELHRRWIVAEDARRHRAAPAAAPSGMPAARPTALPRSAPPSGSASDLDLVADLLPDDGRSGQGDAPGLRGEGEGAGEGAGEGPGPGPGRRGFRFVLVGLGIAALVIPGSLALALAHRPAQRTSGPAPTASAPARPAPLTVSLRPYTIDDMCDQWELLNQTPDRAPPAPSPTQDDRAWLRTHGAVSADSTSIEAAVQGTGAEAVVLYDLQVHIVSRSKPLTWPVFAMADGCGGGLAPAGFHIDLDAVHPRAVAAAGSQGDVPIPAPAFPYKVSASDPQVFDITAGATGHDVSWYLELHWSSGARSGILRIDDGGKPFRTSSARANPRYVNPPGSTGWQRQLPA
ncbi:helix-turn-helix domain-containing protein [Streptacidiphilus sp. PAMC 29251]